MTANDVPFKPGHSACVTPSDLPEHIVTALAEEARLDLLLPQHLPTEQALSTADRAELRAVLTAFLQALQLADRAASLSRIEALLDRLADTSRQPARVEDTGTPATTAQIDDFDAYFRVDRITSDAPAHALTRGLLRTAQANMSLFCRAENLPPQHVAQQIAGFAEYTRLLARTFDLGELS